VTATGQPTAGEGAMSADLAEDKAPSEANGNESEGTWFALNESGKAVKGRATAAAATSETESAPAESNEEESGGYGY
jgi:hypothetical protein